MGYTGRAAIALGFAKQYLNRVDSVLKNDFYITYSRYLVSIGNVEKCTDFCSKLGEQTNEQSCFVKSLLSEVLVSEGKFSEALSNALNSHRYFVKKLQHLQQNQLADQFSAMSAF
jgi:hypothetical protein